MIDILQTLETGDGYRGFHSSHEAQNAAVLDLEDYMSQHPESSNDPIFKASQEAVKTSLPVPAKSGLDTPTKDIQIPAPSKSTAKKVVGSPGSDFLSLIWKLSSVMHDEFPELSQKDIVSALLIWTYLEDAERDDIEEAKEKEGTLSSVSKPPAKPTPDLETIKDFAYYLRFASAAYGKSAAIDPRSLFSQTDQDWIESHTKLPSGAILPYVDSAAAEAGESEYLLEHFVCVDSSRNAVIVALKGTLSFKSAMTDLEYLYVKATAWGEEDVAYDVHGGIWETAKALAVFPKLVDEVKTLLGSNPGYQLVICGHSLGGGVAALLSILWSQRVDGSLGFVTSPELSQVPHPIKCYCFGPAAALDNALAEKSKSMVFTIVNKYDSVPSMNWGTTKNLNIIAQRLDGIDHRTIFNILHSGFARKSVLEGLREIVKSEDHKQLVPPGRVWTVDPDTGEVGEVVDVPARFDEIRFCPRMVLDHFPMEYAASLYKY